MKVNFGSTAPIIDMATREGIATPRLNGAHSPQPSAGHRWAASPPSAGHNSGATAADVAAKENLRRGLYRSQRDALIAVARDPRCTKRHSLVHAIVVGFMNADTGMAFPGWRTIAEKAAMFPGNVPDPAGAYDASTIYNLLSDLRRWGYLPSVKRGPEGGGRAIAHYTIAEPPYEKLQEEITKFILKGRARAQEERVRLDALAARQPDLTTPSEDKDASDLTRVREDRSDLTRGRAADLTRGRATVTCKEEPEENSTAASDEADHAVELWADTDQSAANGARTRKKRSAPRTLIAPDWRPTDTLITWVKKRWFANDRQISVEAEKFREHHASKGSEMLDWSAAWRTWWLNGYHKIPRCPDNQETTDAEGTAAPKPKPIPRY